MPRYTQPRRTWQYTNEFKVKAVELSHLEDVKVQDVAKTLDIHPFMLSRWRKEYREGKMVISLAQDTSEILLKIHSLANKDRHKKVTDLVDSASVLYDRHQDFKQALAEQHPSLVGINFEFGLEGDEFKVLNADFGSRSTLSAEQIKLIEDLANSDDQTSKRLLEVMYKIRETSVNFYNMWSERGRSDPIDSVDFSERFGGFNSYLESFHSAGSAIGKAGPDDPTTYRDSYFSDATQYAVARLAR